jgi:hypothetical protein
MKNSIVRHSLLAAGAILSFACGRALAAESAAPALGPATSAPSPALVASSTTAATASTPATLPHGVEDVLKLSQAQVAEETIVTYIQSSGTTYNLTAEDIVYLREQGVSDRVINTMLEQRTRLTEQAAKAVAPATTPESSAPAYAPAPVVQSQPPASTVYVIPYPDRTYAYYGYRTYPFYNYGYGAYPYYYGYPRFYGAPPAFSFRFGFGGHHPPQFGHPAIGRPGFAGPRFGGPGHFRGGGFHAHPR